MTNHDNPYKLREEQMKSSLFGNNNNGNKNKSGY